MARPASITKEQVIKAGIELESQDKPINPTSLRAAIGGGNPTRLFAIWSEYRGLNPVTETPAQDQEKNADSSLPDVVLRKIERATDQIKHLLTQSSEEAHAEVNALADAEAAKLTADRDLEINKARAETEEAKAELVAAQNKQAHWKQEAVKLAKELNEMTLSAKELAEKKHELSFKLDAAEKLADDRDLEFAETRAEIKKLREKNSNLSKQNAVLGQHIKSVISANSLTESRLTKELDELRADFKKLTAEKSTLAEKNAALSEQNAALEQRKSLAVATENRLNADIAQQQAALDVSRKENAELEAKNARVEGELSGLKQSLAISTRTISDIKKPRITVKKKRIANQENQEKPAAQKKISPQ